MDMNTTSRKTSVPCLRGTYRGALVDMWVLGLESAMVLPLRLAKLARLDREAGREARLMVEEKVVAHVHLAHKVASGRMGRTHSEVTHSLAMHYLGYVRSNRKRLTRAKRDR